jgi:hypothetical protein
MGVEKDRRGGGGLVSSAAPPVQLLPEEKAGAATADGERTWEEMDKRRRLGFDSLRRHRSSTGESCHYTVTCPFVRP